MAVQIDKEQFERDRQGRVKFTVRWKMDTRSEALRSVPVKFEDLPLETVRGTPWIGSDGAYLVDAVYTGIIDELSASLGDGENDQYELITEEREVPIEKFPDIPWLKETYGAFGGEGGMDFPETLPAPASRIGTPLTIANTGAKQGEGGEVPNPMWNTKTYPVPYTVAVWRFVRKTVPTDVERQAMTVIDRLPSGFDWRGPKLQWYVRPIQKRKTGNAWEVEWRAEELTEFTDPEFLRKAKEINGRKR
jgi:hypothetical protein